MKLFNTLSRTVEELQPISPPNVGFYACGFTVYDYTHLGHLRRYTMDDVLLRTLKHAGFQVKFVQNVTDVGHLASDADTGEDKLEKGAKKYNKTVWEVAQEFEDYFWKSMDAMGNLRPDVSCRATDHIQEQLEMVKELERNGHTYVIEGDGVYFDTSTIDDYGKLAGLDVAGLQEGARVEMLQGKRNPTDFALWKFERPGEDRAMVWPSPWHERSFPGWHIECSAMSAKYLGEQFDLHSGGIDHIPVHHTNEIVQAEAASGKKPFVKYWVHHNFIQVEGQKMSKSLGNFFTIDDVLERGFNPMSLRLLFLTGHYRSELNFTWDNLAGAQKAYDKLVGLVVGARAEGERTTLSEDKLAKVDDYRQRFFAHMENDLNTPDAVALLWDVIKSNIPGTDKYDLLIEFDEVLGLELRNAQIATTRDTNGIEQGELPPEIQKLLSEREQARASQNWEQADRLRAELEQHGYSISDTSTGQKISKN